MIEGPIGAAAFNNEFGRPAICGYFRTFEQQRAATMRAASRGYHKPIMIAGGLGNVRAHACREERGAGRREARRARRAGDADRPGRRRGLVDGQRRDERGSRFRLRAAWQRRDPAARAGSHRSLLGAGRRESDPARFTTSAPADCRTRCPKLVAHSKRGARIDLRAHSERRARHVADGDLVQRSAGALRARASPPIGSTRFSAIARARALSVRGDRRSIDDTGCWCVDDPQFGNAPGRYAARRAARQAAAHAARRASAWRHRASRSTSTGVDLRDAAYRVLRFPAVADKTFLITIGDRTVGGLISRDQMVGPWQVPVADVAVTLADHYGHAGEAMAMGERTPVAVLDAPASGRLAVAEAITNILAADIESLSRRPLSANWMAACGEPGEDAALYDDRARRRQGAVPRARYRDSGGQGFAVDEDRWTRGRRAKSRDRAGVADRVGVRARRGCAHDSDAAAAHGCRRDVAAGSSI